MTPSSASSDKSWPYPFWGFHCCLNGEVDNKGIARLISHLKRFHLLTDERKCVLREALCMDHGLYMTVEETLKVFSQWLCGKCMTLRDVSRACHHLDGLVRFSKGSDDMSGYVVGISKTSNTESKTELIEWCVGQRIDKNVDGSGSVSLGEGGGDFQEERKTRNTNIRQYLRKVADGHFTSAVKVLSSSGISCGRDGLRAQHILDALCGEGSATATDLLKDITLV
ncbi:hypothetical protein Tco_1453548, partial [Tanacetum coccineum]